MLYLLIASLCLIGAATAQDEIPTVEISDAGDSGYFTEEWRKEYDEQKLAKQPKWRLAVDQPEDGAYEVREYAPAWWVSSFVPCLNQTVAAQFNYLKLYLYMNKYNSKWVQYELTYPIINKIEKSTDIPEPQAKDSRVACPDRYSVHLYLPHPAAEGNPYNNPADALDESTMTSEDDVIKRRFVKRYEDTFNHLSNDVCNLQAGMLSIELSLDGRSFDLDKYYCALYETGKSGSHGFEVWFDDETQ